MRNSPPFRTSLKKLRINRQKSQRNMQIRCEKKDGEIIKLIYILEEEKLN